MDSLLTDKPLREVVYKWEMKLSELMFFCKVVQFLVGIVRKIPVAVQDLCFSQNLP